MIKHNSKLQRLVDTKDVDRLKEIATIVVDFSGDEELDKHDLGWTFRAALDKANKAGKAGKVLWAASIETDDFDIEIDLYFASTTADAVIRKVQKLPDREAA